jgi:hypothetical protein
MNRAELVVRYQQALLDLISMRASDKPPSLEEEARLAGQREDLWDQIPSDEQIELEVWIESLMTRAR